jgi:5S rRNA maturation endonuclease (ribonuclease M5)
MTARENVCFKLQSCAYKLFKNLGIDMDIYTISGNQVRGICPCHDDSDNTSAFTYYFNKGLWFCWTHGCEKINGQDLIGFIATRKRIKRREAYKFAEEFLKKCKIRNNDIALKLRRAQHTANEKIDYWKKHIMQKPFKESVLDSLKSAAWYAQQRQLAPKVLQEMGAGLASKGKMKNRVVFPIRNIDKKIVGFTGRLSRPQRIKLPKWIHLPKNPRFQVSLNLFNIDRAAKYIRKTGTVIVGEGPFETVKLEMAGYKNSVAIFGLHISQAQIEILKRCGAIHIILAFDPDQASSAKIKDNITRLHNSDFDVRVLKWEGTEDIGAMEIFKLHQVMAQVNDIPLFGKQWRKS